MRERTPGALAQLGCASAARVLARAFSICDPAVARYCACNSNCLCVNAAARSCACPPARLLYTMAPQPPSGKQLVLEFKWIGPAKATGDPLPTHLVGVSPIDDANTLQAQLRMLFDVQPPANLLLYHRREHNGSDQMVAQHVVGILHGVRQYYAMECDEQSLPVDTIVYVQSTQPAIAPTTTVAGSAHAESRCTSKGSKSKTNTSSDGSDKLSRDHHCWVALSDSLWPLAVPR